jgi:hypothetical protein
MPDAPPSDASLDRDLIALFDHALAMVADHVTQEQRALLRARAEKMGLADHIARQCSPDVQGVLLNRLDTEIVNPDGGLVAHGKATGEHAHRKHGSTIEEGSGEASAIPTV